MADSIQIRPTGPLQASVRPPGSKSITNRALVCAALARGESLLTGALESDDTRVMVEGLRQLGLTVDHDADRRTIRVTGCDGHPPAASADLLLGNSGTTVRFLTAMVTLGRGVYRLDGTPRMRERPIQDLLDALRQLGADVASEAGTGCPPVVVRAAGLPGGRAEVAGDTSSQFLSALLQVAPCAERRGAGGPRRIGLQALRGDDPKRNAGLRASRPSSDDIPPRRCAFACGAAVVSGPDLHDRARCLGRQLFLRRRGHCWRQRHRGGAVPREPAGRRGLLDCLRQMGCDVIFGDDQITVKGTLARHRRRHERHQRYRADPRRGGPFAEGPTTIRNVAHIRHKETDRIAALATELRKLGAAVESAGRPADYARPAARRAIDTYDDHRMAMSMALVGLVVPGVVIRNPRCSRRPTPTFFAIWRHGVVKSGKSACLSRLPAITGYLNNAERLIPALHAVGRMDALARGPLTAAALQTSGNWRARGIPSQSGAVPCKRNFWATIWISWRGASVPNAAILTTSSSTTTRTTSACAGLEVHDFG